MDERILQLPAYVASVAPRDPEDARRLARLVPDGATAIEYGLIAAGIAIAIIVAVQGVGTKLSGTFGTISTSLK